LTADVIKEKKKKNQIQKVFQKSCFNSTFNLNYFSSSYLRLLSPNVIEDPKLRDQSLEQRQLI